MYKIFIVEDDEVRSELCSLVEETAVICARRAKPN